MNPVLRRITAGLGANAFSQAASTLIQLVSLPMFLHHWDTATYGQWLLLATVPAYIGMADVGMVTAAANSMTMATGRGDIARARTVFQSTLAFTLLVCAAIALLGVPLLLALPASMLGGLDARLAVIALTLGVLASIIGGLDQAIFRATGRYAVGSALSTLTRIGEWGGTMLGLWIGGSFAAVAIGGLLARIVALALVHAIARQGDHGLRWGFAEARVAEIKAMAKPALSFMAFPITTALSLQGVTLMVGYLFGTAAVALFSTYRTLARVAIQFTTVVSWSVEPEFSSLYGQGGMAAVRPLYRRSLIVCGLLSTGLSLGLYLFGPWLLKFWSHGGIGFEPLVMAILLAYAAAAGLSQIPRMLLMATNQHVGFAAWSLVHSGLGLALAGLLGAWLGLPGVGLSMLATEALIAVTCVFLVRGLRRVPVLRGAPELA